MDFVSKKKGKKKRDSSLKVVYISSPMKVKTSASKFRTIVQKLTGRDSDISTYMESGGTSTNSTTTDFEILPETFGVSSTKSLDDDNDKIYNQPLSSSKSSSLSLMDAEPTTRESPTSSESFLEQSFPFGDVLLNSQMEEQYLKGVFPSDLFSDSSQLDIDVLGSYDAL